MQSEYNAARTTITRLNGAQSDLIRAENMLVIAQIALNKAVIHLPTAIEGDLPGAPPYTSYPKKIFGCPVREKNILPCPMRNLQIYHLRAILTDRKEDVSNNIYDFYPLEQMKIDCKNSIKKLLQSLCRITLTLAIIIGLPALAYCLWSPGSDEPLTKLNNNAVWLGHGWLGDDSWFHRNQRDVNNFRNPKKMTELFCKLSENKISTVYPHLCPAQLNGNIAPYDSGQVEHFLNLAAQYNIKVIPWIGGVFEESARPADEKWRKNFVASVEELLKKHPRLSGVQINIEPLPSGNKDFLILLDELCAVTPQKILSVAAYPPPTRWHNFPDVHWDLAYIKQVALRCDQMAVMMYDTAIPLEKFYIQLMKSWTKELAAVVSGSDCELLLGIPAYEDADVGYHHPQVENIKSALRGISAAECAGHFSGTAIYCEWEMTPEKWQIWRKFIQ